MIAPRHPVDETQPQAGNTPPDTAAHANRLFTWPNLLLIAVLVFACYYRLEHDITQLPHYILNIETLGMGVWLMPFALFYNIQGGKKATVYYALACFTFALSLPTLTALFPG